MQENFYIGQIFENGYPAQAAVWCNAHGALIQRNANGFVIAQKVLSSLADMAQSVRIKRDMLLCESDRYMAEDFPITAAQKQAFREYRQALRDVPLQTEFPQEVVFPQKP